MAPRSTPLWQPEQSCCDDDMVGTGLAGVDFYEEIVGEAFGINHGNATRGGVREDLEMRTDLYVIP